MAWWYKNNQHPNRDKQDQLKNVYQTSAIQTKKMKKIHQIIQNGINRLKKWHVIGKFEKDQSATFQVILGEYLQKHWLNKP